MVNNWYACQEQARMHQAELESEAARASASRLGREDEPAARGGSLFAGVAGRLRAASHRSVLAGRHGAHRPSRAPRFHLPHRHAPAAR